MTKILHKKFKVILKNNPILVVTDYDFSGSGLNGFYGLTIARWCKSKLIPIGEYSDKDKFGNIVQPNLFDISVPSGHTVAPVHIASIVNGFISFRNFIESNKEIVENKFSLSKIISLILGREHLQLHFNQYIESIDKVSIIYERIKKVSTQKLRTITTYIIGYLLLNSILKYPGPIISEQVLCSYLSIATSNSGDLKRVFKKAIYQGP